MGREVWTAEDQFPTSTPLSLASISSVSHQRHPPARGASGGTARGTPPDAPAPAHRERPAGYAPEGREVRAAGFDRERPACYAPGGGA